MSKKQFAILLIVLLCTSLYVFGELDAERVRVYVTDSDSWAMSGGKYGVSAGARPQTAEIIKTFREKCPKLTMTIRGDRANFIVLLDRETMKGPLLKRNKVVVFDAEGDAIYSGSTRSIGNAVKDACKAIMENR